MLSAVFGPQHGIYGQTQDNMIEWEGDIYTNFVNFQPLLWAEYTLTK